MRKVKFETGNYYHVYNRGVDKREVFLEEKDYFRFLSSMREFNSAKPVGSLFLINRFRKGGEALRALQRNRLLEPLVEIISYNLIKNHFHLIIKQIADNGISKFMLKLGMGYTNYFNQKHLRSGSLFQGVFQAVHIDSDQYLLYLSAYINGNSEIHGVAKTKDWRWNSLVDYAGVKSDNLCRKEIILSQFKDIEEYNEYIKEVVREAAGRKDEIKQYLLE